MILVFSDLHLGRFPEQDEKILGDLRSCILSTVSSSENPLKEIILLGDVFDSFMEFKGHVPEAAEGMVELIDEWRSVGINVCYHVGNHDPWHLSFFDDFLDGQLFRKPHTRRIGDRTVYLSHGDEADEYSVLGRWSRFIMRNEWSFKIYSFVMPRRQGQRFPQLISRKFAGLEPQPSTIRALHLSGLEILDSSEIDLVIYGHAHQSSTDISTGGQYINTGSWLLSRSYAELTDISVRILLYSPN